MLTNKNPNANKLSWVIDNEALAKQSRYPLGRCVSRWGHHEPNRWGQRGQTTVGGLIALKLLTSSMAQLMSSSEWEEGQTTVGRPIILKLLTSWIVDKLDDSIVEQH